MKIKIYESLELVKDKTQDNLWILNIEHEELPKNIHYDEVISSSFYPIKTKVPAMLGKIAKYIKETTSQEWNWEYTVYVKNRESLRVEKTDSYVVPFSKIVEIK